MTRQDFITWAQAHGYTLDQYGHLQKTQGDAKFRYKLSRTAVRSEVQITFENGKHEWLRRRSGYFSKLAITPDGKLAGMTR